MQWHLPALGADLVEAARAGALPLVAATGRLTPARADAAADAMPGALRARRGLESVQFHVSIRTRWLTLLIMPRTAGVSTNSTTWSMRLSPRPRTVSRCERSQPTTLFSRRTLIFFIA